MGGNIAVNVPIPSIPSSGKLVACNPKSMKQTLLLTYFNLVTLLSYMINQAYEDLPKFRSPLFVETQMLGLLIDQH